MRMPKNLGTLLIAIWFILYGLIGLFGLSFRYIGELMGALALVAGVLLLLERCRGRCICNRLRSEQRDQSGR